jgi:EGF-like domain
MCSRDYGIMNGYPECSGNGVCNNVTSQCICHSGWTSRTDFLTDPYYDCDINILTVEVLAVILVLVSGIGVVFSLISIYRRLPISAKKMRDPTTVYSITFLGGCIGAFIHNVPKCIDPVQYILSPDNPAVIVGWVIYQFFWMWAAAYFGCILGLFIKNYTKLIPHPDLNSKLMERALYACKTLPIMQCPTFLFPVALAIFPDRSEEILSAFLYYFAGALFTVAFADFLIANEFLKLLSKILKETERSTCPPGLNRVYTLMFCVFILNVNGVFIVGPAHIVFGIMPYFRRKYIYLGAIFQLTWCIGGVCILISQMKKSSRIVPYASSARNRIQNNSILSRIPRFSHGNRLR